VLIPGSAAGFAILLVAPGLALAQVPHWDFSLSAFAGWAKPFNTDITGTDPGVPFRFEARDVGLKSSITFGGRFGAWWTRARTRTGLDLGAELDITQFFPEKGSDPSAAGLPAAGGSAGTPGASRVGLGGGLLASKIDISTTIAAANFLARYPMGVTGEWPSGRWYPYVGIGGGVEIGRAQTGSFEDTDAAGAFQALAGLKVFVERHLALFAEYKFTHANHSFRLGTETDEISLNVNHIVMGLAVHF
jgi:opacity protein-like surface antigen